MKIAIIGQGYVGRSIVEASVGAGHSVIGFDTDSSVISSLRGLPRLFGLLSSLETAILVFLVLKFFRGN